MKKDERWTHDPWKEDILTFLREYHKQSKPKKPKETQKKSPKKSTRHEEAKKTH